MLLMQSIRFAMKSREVENGNRSGRYNYSIPSKERKSAQMQQIRNHLFNKLCQQGVVNSSQQHNEMHADSCQKNKLFSEPGRGTNSKCENSYREVYKSQNGELP